MGSGKNFTTEFQHMCNRDKYIHTILCLPIVNVTKYTCRKNVKKISNLSLSNAIFQALNAPKLVFSRDDNVASDSISRPCARYEWFYCIVLYCMGPNKSKTPNLLTQTDPIQSPTEWPNSIHKFWDRHDPTRPKTEGSSVYLCAELFQNVNYCSVCPLKSALIRGIKVNIAWGRCSVGRVGHGPPKILVGWATMHLAPPIIGLYVRYFYTVVN